VAAIFNVMAKEKVLCPFCKKLEECTIVKPGTLRQTYECPQTNNHFEAETNVSKNLPKAAAGAGILGVLVAIVVNIFGGGGHNGGKKFS
jgi:hypothetical protein